MKKSKISPDICEIKPEATLVFQRSNSVVVFSNPIVMSTNPNEREIQERLLMENKEGDPKKIEEEFFLDENISEKENNLPKSCFEIFRVGVKNNLQQISKYIGTKR
jgi:hypothetical protein